MNGTETVTKAFEYGPAWGLLALAMVGGGIFAWRFLAILDKHEQTRTDASVKTADCTVELRNFTEKQVIFNGEIKEDHRAIRGQLDEITNKLDRGCGQ